MFVQFCWIWFPCIPFIFSFDVRGKPLQQARHWSAPEIFGPRAKFNTDTDPATLDIEVNIYLRWKKCSFKCFSPSSFMLHKLWSNRYIKLNSIKSIFMLIFMFYIFYLFRIFEDTTRVYIDVVLTFVQVKHRAFATI